MKRIIAIAGLSWVAAASPCLSTNETRPAPLTAEQTATQVVARASGWFTPTPQGLHAEFEVGQADVQYLATQASAVGTTVLDGYGGSASLKAIVDRPNRDKPAVSSGALTVVNASLRDEPLTGQDIKLTWTNVQVGQEGGELNAELVSLESEMAQVTATGVRARSPEAEALTAGLSHLRIWPS